MRIHVAAFAAATVFAAFQTSAASAGMATGPYACWYFSDARLTFNFTVLNADSYNGYDGTPGKYALDAASKEVTFVSGTLEGAMPDGFKAIYEVRQGIPTLAYISPRGAEALFCQNS